MTIQARQVGDVVVLQLAGKMSVGEGGLSVRGAVQDAMRRGAGRLLLHLGAVPRADSSGIGDLVTANTMAINGGATLKLCHVPSSIKQALTITQLIHLLDIYDTEADAIASFPR